MTRWIRFTHEGSTAIGALDGDLIHVHAGELFDSPEATGQTVNLADVRVEPPCVPGKMICLANNFHALLAKIGQPVPAEPLWFLKANTALHPHGQPIRMPAQYAGKVIYEAELGIVIGQRCQAVSEAEAATRIFGYTCVNDVTAIDILRRDPGFEQWTRSKSFDTFGVIGPVIATGLDPMGLTIKLFLNEQERQNYPVSDMVFPPAKLVSLLSHDVTLEPGDVIACGTSVGVGSMKPGSEVRVVIDGIGELVNRFE
ncbi:MAG: fumarylacetoacetate hydrolase family protein [Burkholderiales bacterium]|nr:fumarylacetoacetate hydrolase family protein [Burkholderiales bacterium]